MCIVGERHQANDFLSCDSNCITEKEKKSMEGAKKMNGCHG